MEPNRPLRAYWDVMVITGLESDRELWLAVKSGDSTAFGELFRRHATTVANYCAYRNGTFRDAEDLTATVFLEAWRSRDLLVVGDPGALPLLFGIAAHVTAHHRRGIARRLRAVARLGPSDSPVDAGVDSSDEICSRLDAQRDARVVHRALSRLSPGQRAAVELCFMGDLTTEQAALTLGVPVGTVKSRLSRARTILQESLAPRVTHPQEELK
jgi:RNA polymerase sigma factor (sigma-70 family)